MGRSTKVLRPTYYEILQIPHDSKPIDPTELKLAYRRALLLHHPDKNYSSSPATLNTTHISQYAPSIDQITEAYKTLSSTLDKAEYDKLLAKDAMRLNKAPKEVHHPGLEILDLEELSLNHQTNTWTRQCRCGDELGYNVTESDLEEESEHGEIYVGCNGCSLFIKVLFDTASASNDTEDPPQGTRPISEI
ncbi:hypothetical protein GJ744_004370 [Endocarpon pusillum]|uniref:Diphthamide biosynthesis protein 4 n=1 Tax=Endocarpon pusillum TaxID=364733 RepID=A0A8H7EA02_9EURO|nr:hypothetical protein GJ744_004370 [Endocarpon pusillum]